MHMFTNPSIAQPWTSQVACDVTKLTKVMVILHIHMGLNMLLLGTATAVGMQAAGCIICGTILPCSKGSYWIPRLCK